MNNITDIPSSVVTLQPKIIVGSQTIFSKFYKRVKKRNSYTIAYSHPQAPNQLNYGHVQKFLSCPADSPNSLHYAVIKQLKVKDHSEHFNLVFPPEIKCLAQQLCFDFVLVEECGKKVAIPVEHIKFKCFDISTTALTT